jgi:hypothetical protein
VQPWVEDPPTSPQSPRKGATDLEACRVCVAPLRGLKRLISFCITILGLRPGLCSFRPLRGCRPQTTDSFVLRIPGRSRPKLWVWHATNRHGLTAGSAPTDEPNQVQIPRKLILGEISFLWLNGDSRSLVQGRRSAEGGSEVRPRSMVRSARSKTDGAGRRKAALTTPSPTRSRRARRARAVRVAGCGGAPGQRSPPGTKFSYPPGWGCFFH